MLTGKQRAYLRGLANDMQPIFQIGKNGIEETFLKQVEEALEKGEKVQLVGFGTFETRERAGATITTMVMTMAKVVAVTAAAVATNSAKRKIKKRVTPLFLRLNNEVVVSLQTERQCLTAALPLAFPSADACDPAASPFRVHVL